MADPLRDSEVLRDEPSTLERFFTFLGRPGYVANSLLRGEVGDAVENTAMFGEELLTGSWLHGKRLTSLLPGGDSVDGLTTRAERPEFADTLRTWGSPVDQGSWTELGANLVGGALTDPLTYVGGIGLGSKLGRVGKGALVGLRAGEGVVESAARSTLTRALLESTAGRAALEQAGSAEKLLLDAINAADAQPLALRLVAEEAQRVRKTPELFQEAVAPLATLGSPATEGQIAAAVDQLAARRVGLTADGRVTLTGNDVQAELLDAGVRALEGKGLIRPAGVPTLEIPGASWVALPGGRETWEKIGLATPLRAANAVLGAAAPGVAEALGKVGAETFGALYRTFVDRRGFGNVAPGLRSAATQFAGELLDRQSRAVREIPELFREVGKPGADALAEEWRRADDLFRRGVTPEQRAEAYRRLGVGDPNVPEAEVARRMEEVHAALPQLGQGEAADGLRVVYADTRQRAIQRAVDAGANPTAAARALDAYVDDVMRMPQDLVDRGLWAKADATPFYLPSQASDELALFMASGSPSKRVNGTTYAEALKDVFTRSREHANVAETTAAFKKVAERYGVPVPDLEDVASNYDAANASGLFKSGLDALWLRRKWAHNATVARADFEKLARGVMQDVRHATTLDDFLHATLTGVGARENVVGKLLGGGRFRFGGELGRVAEGAKSVLGGRAGAVDGRRGWIYDWPGINSIFKPAQYLPSLSTFTRNGLGGVVMGAMDPEIGLGGAAGLLSALRDLPLVRSLAGAAPRDVQAALVAVATDRATDAQKALLRSSKIGKHSAESLAQHLRNGVLGNDAVTDRAGFEAIGDVQQFLEQVDQREGWAGLSADMAKVFKGKGLTTSDFAPRTLERYRAFWKPLGRLNQTIENGLRAGAFVKLVRDGYDPATAVERVRQTFVDYAYQSGSERMLRDLLPFVRFTLGAGPNAIAGATSPLGRAVGRLAVGSDDGRPLPPEIRGQVSIPLGGDTYATSLGLPFEAGATLLGLVPGAQGWNRNAEQNVLGALSTPLRTVAERATGKQFYSDLPLSEVRPIGPLPPFVVHSLMGFLPISRFRSELDKLVKSFYGDWRSAVNATTGVKLRTVDSEREAERLVTRWLERAVEEGRVGHLERFFAKKGEPVPPDVQQALETLATLEKKRKAKS